MEIDLYLPSFRAMRKRSRSRSPTPCEHDRPLKRSSALALAVGDGTRELSSSFTPPQSTSPSTPAQGQPLSAFMVVPASVPQSAYTPAVDVDVGIQDEWVALTRNLTLLASRGPADHESVMCGSREEVMMNLDEHPQPSALLYSHAQHLQHGAQESPLVGVDHMAPHLLNPQINVPALNLPSSHVTLPAAVAFLRAPSPPTMPTPPLCTAPLPSHSPFISAGIGTPPVARLESQPLQQTLPSPARRSRFTMGPRPDCDKCRSGVPGHYAHFD